jgi:DNA-directed RNA polymerase I subunit RPA2
MTSKQLVEKKEEPNELGGYFLINGNERLVRFLILPRSNHVTALERPSFANRGPSYSRFGCAIRCVHPDDLVGITNTIHYLENGSITLRFSMRKQEYMIPVVLVLKSLVNATDKEIFTSLIQNDYDNTFLTDRVEMLLRGFKSYNLWTGDQCLEFLGSKFRIAMGLPEDYSDMQVGAELISRIVLIHLDHPKEKFKMLVFMMRKLYSLVAGETCIDNPDSPQHQEVLLPGFLYGQIIKERLDEYLSAMRLEVNRQIRLDPKKVDFFNNTWISKIVGKINPNIGGRLSSFLATGTLSSPTGLDLQQTTGFTIIAEKLNFYRYISHFRCVHRGAFFAELKTTTVRKLLPESWGFLCPVHTPDGSPCGLLNHFTHTCRLITRTLDATSIPSLLTDMGLVPALSHSIDGRYDVVVQLDGCILGYASPKLAQQMATAVRNWKSGEMYGVPHDLEVGFVPTSKGGQFPGLYLFSGRSRMMRPVKLLSNGKEDSIGSFEQVYLNIACQEDEIEANHTTHVEYSPISFLSLIASMTPFSDFNQSPRNIYQCQMGKQTMGTPSTAINHRTDNKLYRLQSPQTPIVRPAIHNRFGFDDAPNGANAVVAVISYTGYDMEDAMILNKSAHERGFGYGSIYKSEVIDLKDIASGKGKSTAILPVRFGIGNDIKADSPYRAELDVDGLPLVANRVKAGSPICAIFDETTGKTIFKKYKTEEEAYIDTVRIIGSDSSEAQATKLQITFRVPRSPVIGDKFSSRHGQKGVCSQKWPAIDMPFSESGMTPDVIINPHAFPSRMTIGMLIESMAGKAGAMHGISQDATAFGFSEEDTPVEYFGEQLKAAGYNFVGHEPMYSGITGQELKMDIYLGVVYYQRLRHMVNDKFQVRTTGPVHQLTRQPIKGRKRAGGIRFGEMERDALLAHGTSFLLQDRLMNCSDYSTSYICRTCGSLISLGFDEDANLHGIQTIDRYTPSRANLGPKGEYCRICRDEDGRVNQDAPGLASQVIALPKDNVIKRGNGDLDVVAIPYVLKYLVAELASMSMRLSFTVES